MYATLSHTETLNVLSDNMNCIFVILLMGFQGIDSITSVKRVEVKVGQTLIIPCLYEAKQKRYPKFFAYYDVYDGWQRSVNTNGYTSSDRFSISDDPIQNVFTVTMRNMKWNDTHRYRCGYEGLVYPEAEFDLSVKVFPGLSVSSQYVTRHVGGSVAINCNYSSGYRQEKKWCRIGGNCAGSYYNHNYYYINYNHIWGLSVKLSGDDYYASTGVLKVTLKDLQESHTGWYYCSVGDLQMPVHVAVIQNTTTLETSTKPSINTFETTYTVDAVPSTSSANQTHPQTASNLPHLLGLLGLLLLVIICGSVTLAIHLRKRKHTGPGVQTDTRDRSDGHMVSREDSEEASYTNIPMTTMQAGGGQDGVSPALEEHAADA
ncbi:uncharacterized protein LOC134456084 [Engraulis encrasicolus]|uniref:uncharacterized protein LOC134456084 n=1 Tax=Engraulis encrasicolus TaxID=184585 RepID=UPI002FD2AA33